MKKVKSRPSFRSSTGSAGGGESSELQDKVNYLMWLNNKLRMSLRNVHTLQQHKQQLTKQVCTHTGYTELLSITCSCTVRANFCYTVTNLSAQHQ